MRVGEQPNDLFRCLDPNYQETTSVIYISVKRFRKSISSCDFLLYAWEESLSQTPLSISISNNFLHPHKSSWGGGYILTNLPTYKVRADSHGSQVTWCRSVESQLLRAWKLGLTTSHRVPSPKYDKENYMTTLFGGETWDLCCELARLIKELDPTLSTPCPASIFVKY